MTRYAQSGDDLKPGKPPLGIRGRVRAVGNGIRSFFRIVFAVLACGGIAIACLVAWLGYKFVTMPRPQVSAEVAQIAPIAAEPQAAPAASAPPQYEPPNFKLPDRKPESRLRVPQPAADVAELAVSDGEAYSPNAETELKLGESGETTKTPATAAAAASSGQVSVKGYYRKDGTWVAPHTRNVPKDTIPDTETKTWVGPYVREDGTKVKGYWRKK